MPLLAIVLLWMGNPAWAIEKMTPLDEGYKEIATQINAAKDIDETVKEENRKLKDRNTSPADIPAINQTIKDLERKRSLAYNKAIWMAIEYYQILPPNQGLPTAF